MVLYIYEEIQDSVSAVSLVPEHVQGEALIVCI